MNLSVWANGCFRFDFYSILLLNYAFNLQM
jgi:hypothetical protein